MAVLEFLKRSSFCITLKTNELGLRSQKISHIYWWVHSNECVERFFAFGTYKGQQGQNLLFKLFELRYLRFAHLQIFVSKA